MKPCCPCDRLTYPNKLDIPAGLNALPRQLTEFSESRLAMLQGIRRYPSLAQWRAREGDDLGIMLLEMWAYILDILSFYDERIANETYLRTAIRPESLYKLTKLIGYSPRPALAASVILAAIADGKQTVILPPRTAFRSDAFADEPPQIFETEIEQTIHPFLNQWLLEDSRDPFPNGNELLLEPDSITLSIDQLVLLRGKNLFHVGRVTQLETVNGLDGNAYFTLEVDPPPTLDSTVPLNSIEVLSPTLSASPSLFKKKPPVHPSVTQLQDPSTPSNSDPLEVRESQVFASEILSRTNLIVENQSPTSDFIPFETREFALPVQEALGNTDLTQQTSQTTINLDAIYPQFSENDPVIVQRGNQLRSATIIQIEVEELAVSQLAVSQQEDSPTITVTQIVITPELPESWTQNLSRLVIHFQMIHGGNLTRIAKTRLDQVDFQPSGIAIAGLVDPLPEGVSTAGQLLFQDNNNQGLLVNGDIAINDQGQGNVSVDSNTPRFNPLLRTPITVFGNLIQVSRGETVIDEVLGSGDSGQIFQSFTLQNNPLTYFNDPSTPTGRRSTLAIRINGILWQEVLSFFGAKPQAQVYIVRQNDQQESTITFGDGITGARLPTGIDNVTATYRFGAGAAKPLAGGISQLANPVEGLRRAVNPVAAGGGAEGDRPQDIRRNASESALILGRAISIPDFEARTREFGGVINTRVEWAWDETCQETVVKVWVIADGGDITQNLKGFLMQQADPTTPFVVIPAIAQPATLMINVQIAPRVSSQMVLEQIRQTLTHPETGLFALANIPIGYPLFRSQIFAEILAVEGTCGVSSMTLNGNPVDLAITVQEGHYQDFLTNLVIEEGRRSRGDKPFETLFQSRFQRACHPVR